MSSQSDPLAGLAEVESCKEIKEIVDGAFKSLQIIEPWRGAKTDHPQLQLAIQKIQAHSVVYFEAIDTSIKTAQDGYGFSTDAIELCGFLLEKDTDPADLKEYLADMQDKAKRAHEDSKVTLEKFRDVRRGLIEITKTIPKEALANPKEGQNFVVRFVSRIVGEKRDVEIDKALEELDVVALDMKNLSDNVDKFAGWWAGMETVLSKTKQDSQGLKPGQNTLRVKQIRTKWTKIQDDYQQYKVEIMKLQDYYPSQIEAA